MPQQTATDRNSVEFILGLPYLANGILLDTAKQVGATILLSANAFSVWSSAPSGVRRWEGFNHRPLRLLTNEDGSVTPAYLDSAGFVAMVRNRGYEWTVDRYMDLCAAGPWRRFSSMDLCVESEVARDEEAVLDRISGTIRLNNACLRAARERGIEDRFMPVIQGWGVDHYLRCLDRMFDMSPFPVIGVGSMCRRHVKGQHGILQVVDALDRALGGSARTRLHLFGLKSSGMAELRGHPRVASVDSQAYGIAARQNALRGGSSKTTVYLASVMAGWYRQQVARLSEPAPYRFPAPPGLLELRPPPPENPVERRMASAAEDLRALHEAGEIEWTDLNPLAVHAWASDDEEAEGATDAPSDDVTAGAPLRPAA